MNLNDFLDHLSNRGGKPRRVGNSFQALCPAHDDRTPSLSISQGRDGRVLVKCFANCSTEDVVARLGLSLADLSGSAPTRTDRSSSNAPIATYGYVDEEGNELFEVRRFANKRFSQRRPNGQGWVYNLGGVRRVPYRLPQLLQAIARDAPVFIVEGEKDADRLSREGLSSTTNPHGAGKWRDEYSAFFKNAQVIVIPDHDEEGRKHALAVTASVSKFARSVKTVALTDQPEGGDVSSWLDSGHNAADLLQLMDSFPSVEADGIRFVQASSVRSKATSVTPVTDVTHSGDQEGATSVTPVTDVTHSGDQEGATSVTDVTDVTHSGDQEGAQTDGADLLNQIESFLAKFVAYPSEHARVVHTAWIAHTHLMDAWESTPRLAFLSPEPASGKTRAIEISELLVPRPVEAVNVTPAYLFRKVAAPEGRPSILYDEIDTLFGPRAKENEEIRGLLNAGHRRGAVAGRCVVRGNVILTEEIPAYCAVALAGLGGLPDTILTRSVVIRMRPRLPSERIQAYRRRAHAPEGEQLRERLSAWALTVQAQAAAAWPMVPDGIEDRNADIFEALLVVADLAGQNWPERARAAAVALVAESKESSPSLGVRLLADLKRVFDTEEVLFTEQILRRLHELEEAPWNDLRGGPLNARGLAQRLRAYGVRSRTVRIGGATAKGYAREDLQDPWDRYLPSSSPESVTSVTTSQESPPSPRDEIGNPSFVTDVTDVTHSQAQEGESYLRKE